MKREVRTEISSRPRYVPNVIFSCSKTETDDKKNSNIDSRRHDQYVSEVHHLNRNHYYLFIFRFTKKNLHLSKSLRGISY